jgi:predicted subunit of tRNA(5-methylaminomethyl-2-thiouridylate) methyltransferase
VGEQSPNNAVRVIRRAALRLWATTIPEEWASIAKGNQHDDRTRLIARLLQAWSRARS